MNADTFKNGVIGRDILVYAGKSLYSKDAVFKCLYWFGDKFHISISDENDAYAIRLKLNADLRSEEFDLELYRQKLERDLIDFNLRDIVTKETRNVRDLLIAKAFSNGEFEEPPPGSITDPVGFNIDVKL